MWDYFDRVYVITIPGSKLIDRLKTNFEAINLTKYEIIEFTPAAKTINDGSNAKDLSVYDIMNHNVCDDTCQNITNNHCSLIQKCYDDDVNDVLIFEDDAEFELPINEKKLERVREWMKTNEWDMFFFGYCNFTNPFIYPITTDIVRLPMPYLAHAYALSRSGIAYIIENKHKMHNVQIDDFYRSVPLRKYGIYKSICFQAKDPALFTLAMTKVGLPDLTLKGYSKTSENLSIVLPIIILVVCIIIFVVLIYVFISLYKTNRSTAIAVKL